MACMLDQEDQKSMYELLDELLRGEIHGVTLHVTLCNQQLYSLRAAHALTDPYGEYSHG